MYVKNGISLRHLARNALPFTGLVTLWTVIIIYLYEVQHWVFLAAPEEPIAVIGVVVTIYLGFKTRSSYERWWEARQIWGDIVNASRDWAVQVHAMPATKDGGDVAEMKRTLILAHLAWLNSLSAQLRGVSNLKPVTRTRMFDHRLKLSDPAFHQVRQSLERFLSKEERDELSAYAHPAYQILLRQGLRLRRLFDEGALDSIRYSLLMNTLTRFHNAQGASERIKNTPFPQQISVFGRVFTLFLIVLLPFAFVDEFQTSGEAHILSRFGIDFYMGAMIVFTVLLSYILYVMEKISESTEDPFEGGPFDVPISMITRKIEIDLLEVVGDEPIPEPIGPIDGAVY